MKGGDRACPRLALDVQGRVQDAPPHVERTHMPRTGRTGGVRRDRRLSQPQRRRWLAHHDWGVVTHIDREIFVRYVFVTLHGERPPTCSGCFTGLPDGPSLASSASLVSGTRSGTPGGEVDVCVTTDHDAGLSAAGDGADPVEPGSGVVAA